VSEKDIRNALIIIAIYAITRLPLIVAMPLALDEALYSTMIFEQSHHPTMIPTFLGYPVNWKPAPFFWIYDALAMPLMGSPLPLEALLRWPSFIFGLLSLLPLYLVFRKSGASKNASLVSLAVFILSGVSIYAQTTLITDSALFLFLISSLYLYVEDGLGRWRFLAAGLLAFAAFFMKLVFAFMIPVLAVAWFLIRDKKTLKDPVFLISLLMPFIAAGLHYLILQGAGLGNELYFGLGGLVVGTGGLMGRLDSAYGALGMLALYSPIWVGLFIIGVIRDWKKNLFMAIWAALIAIPLMSSGTLQSYYLPVLPALSFFAASVLIGSKGQEKADLFFLISFSMLAIASLSLYALLQFQEYRFFLPEKEAGLMLAGKQDVLVIGGYKPSILAYKMGTEYRTLGTPLDVGWVFLQPDMGPPVVADFVEDYHTTKYNVTDGSLRTGFYKSIDFRKDSNITRFEYVVIAGRDDYSPADSALVYSDDLSGVFIYKVN
jgi:4-amino-4-deoxy-L-arabinose transferase-like glycosyltransferase